VKVFITGATGFVGSHLAQALVNAGYEVRALARTSSNIRLLQSLGIEVAKGDITDAAAVERAVRNCQLVYHVAAITSQARASKKEYYAVNAHGTDNVARAAIKAGVQRFVYVSTAGVYGTIKSPPVDEDTQPKPNSHYRASKLLGETIVLSQQKKDGLPAVIVRIASVIGPRSTSWLGLMRSVTRARFRILGTGQNHIHMGYVSDIVDGIRLCAEVKGIDGRLYLVAGNEALTVKELITVMAQELGVSVTPGSRFAGPFAAFHHVAQTAYGCFGVELPYAHRYELFLTDNIFDLSRARQELNYKPQVSTGDGLRRTIHWYREKGYLA